MSANQNQNQNENNDNANEKRRGLGAKLISATSTVTGYKRFKRNFQILSHRASFPLARRIFKKELSTNKAKPKAVNYTDIDEKDIRRSLLAHTLIITVTIPAMIWCILILTKALAIGIKFSIWSPVHNQGLYTSVPMIIFIGSKLYVSWNSRKAFKLMQSSLPPNTGSSSA